MYVGLLADRIRSVTKGQTNDEDGDFTSWRDCVDQSFTLRQTYERAWKRHRVHVGFMDLEKEHDRINRETL